jgi:putative transposase
MRLMGSETIFPKPRTSRPSLLHKVYPYLLRGVAVEGADQVWAEHLSNPLK